MVGDYRQSWFDIWVCYFSSEEISIKVSTDTNRIITSQLEHFISLLSATTTPDGFDIKSTHVNQMLVSLQKSLDILPKIITKSLISYEKVLEYIDIYFLCLHCFDLITLELKDDPFVEINYQRKIYVDCLKYWGLYKEVRKGEEKEEKNMNDLVENQTKECGQIVSGGEGNVFNGNLPRQGSLTLPISLSQKTVDEVWREVLMENVKEECHSKDYIMEPSLQNDSVEVLPVQVMDLRAHLVHGSNSSRKPKILLAACGGVAAIKFANLCSSINEWAEVRAVATDSSLQFIDRVSIPRDVALYTDDADWSNWRKFSDRVLHIELTKWADIMLIAPLSANTLAKIAGGLCDNLLTCIVRAWDNEKPMFVVPSMNSSMWANSLTERHIVDCAFTVAFNPMFNPLLEASCEATNLMKDQGLVQEAYNCYLEAIRIHPTFAIAWSNLAGLFMEAGDLTRALQYYKEAIKLKPNFADAYLNLGSVYKALGMAQDAIVCYQRAVRSRPDYSMAFGNLASIYYEQNNLDMAIVNYKRAIACDPGFLEVYNNLGNALKDSGRVEEAINCFRQCLSLQPSHPQALTNLGNIYMEWNMDTLQTQITPEEHQHVITDTCFRVWDPGGTSIISTSPSLTLGRLI